MIADQPGDTFAALLDMDRDAPPAAVVVQADIGHGFSSDDSYPANPSSPLAGSYLVQHHRYDLAQYRNNYVLSESQLRHADSRSDVLLPPELKARGIKLTKQAKARVESYLQTLCNNLNFVRYVVRYAVAAFTKRKLMVF